MYFLVSLYHGMHGFSVSLVYKVVAHSFALHVYQLFVHADLNITCICTCCWGCFGCGICCCVECPITGTSNLCCTTTIGSYRITIRGICSQVYKVHYWWSELYFGMFSRTWFIGDCKVGCKVATPQLDGCIALCRSLSHNFNCGCKHR